MKINTEIEFGNPQIECARFGICKILIPDELSLLPLSFGRALAQLTYEIETNTIHLRLFRESMTDMTATYYLRNESLLIEEDMKPYVSPSFDTFWQEFRLKAGTYVFDIHWATTIDLATPNVSNNVLSPCGCAKKKKRERKIREIKKYLKHSRLLEVI
jgi:hypothetical protein